jgi:hypothetical protein
MEELPTINQTVIETLLVTFNNDNIRVTRSPRHHGESPRVRERLVASTTPQESLLVQAPITDTMVVV